MNAVSAAVLLTVVLASTAAWAQKPRPGTNPSGGGNPCRADAMRLCPESFADAPARMACMKRHRAELSPACLQQAKDQRGR